MVYIGELYSTHAGIFRLTLVQTGDSCKWTNDSKCLLLEHFDAISGSPSQIYHSALPFSPSSSWLHKHYSAELLQEVKVIKGLPAEWGTCSRTVGFDSYAINLACWKDTIAVATYWDITILDGITGSQAAILSGHTNYVRSVVFSSDGTLLVSGSDDRTVKLWDVQTGGVIKAFCGHSNYVLSVSISVDCATIASGSLDKTIRLWNIQSGECYHVIQHKSSVDSVCFSPLSSQHLIFISDSKVWQWTADGHQITPTYNGSHAAFSLDGTQFALCNGAVVQIWSSDFRAVMAEFHMANTKTRHCCFSPDGRLVAIAAGHTAYVWDISNPGPCLIETFVGHSGSIISLAFSSPTSLVSVSWDKSVKFWQIGTSLVALTVTDSKPIPLVSPIKSITLQAKDKIAISSDSDGVVKIWDLQTGFCKASFWTPAKGSCQRDAQLVNGRVIFIWYTDKKVHISYAERGEVIQTADVSGGDVVDIRISGDGSTVICLFQGYIQGWSRWTGEAGNTQGGISTKPDTFLTIDGSSVWVNQPWNGITGWHLGLSHLGPPSIEDCFELPKRPHLDFIGGIRKERSFLPGIENIFTGEEVLRLPGKYARPTDAQWDGRYLVAGYDSGEVLILDCNNLLLH